MRALPLAVLAVGALLAATAGAAPGAPKTQGGATAYSIKIVIPGQPAAGTAAASAPPDAVALGGSFTYPADGSVATTQAVSASASTDAGVRTADATGTSEVDALSLFGGEITATRLIVRALANATPDGSSGNSKSSAIEGLTVLGQPVTPALNTTVPIGDWGTAVVLEAALDQSGPKGKNAAKTTIAALDIQLTQAHGGLPSGSQILVAYAEATARAEAAPPPPPPPPPPPGPTRPPPPPPPPTQPSHGPTSLPTHAPEPKPSPFGSRTIQPAPKHHPIELTAGPYVFPVFGQVSFSDTFGALPRRHGLASRRRPLRDARLAAARCREGHRLLGGMEHARREPALAARPPGQPVLLRAPLRVFASRRQRRAGQRRGCPRLRRKYGRREHDAVPPPLRDPPVSLLCLGYDGVVDPTQYLMGWEHLRNLSFSGGVAKSTVAAIGKAQRPRRPSRGQCCSRSRTSPPSAGLDPAGVKQALARGQGPRRRREPGGAARATREALAAAAAAARGARRARRRRPVSLVRDSGSAPKILSFSHLRVEAPEIGLNSTPIKTPVSSRKRLRPVWSAFP